MTEIRLENTEQVLTGFHIFQTVCLIWEDQNSLSGLKRKVLLFHGDGGGAAQYIDQLQLSVQMDGVGVIFGQIQVELFPSILIKETQSDFLLQLLSLL